MKKRQKIRSASPQLVSHVELQEAVNNAYAAVMFHLALSLGLINGPEINVERCKEILAEGRAHRLYPQKPVVIGLIAREIDAEDPTLGLRFAERLWEELLPQMSSGGH